MSILQDGAGIQWCCGQFLDCHPGWQKDLSLDVKQIEKTLNSFGMFTHGVSCFFISLGKFACIREQFKSSMSHLEVCDLAMRGCCDVVFFFPLRNRQRIRISETWVAHFPQKKRAERHAGPRKMDLQMDQKVRIFFFGKILWERWITWTSLTTFTHEWGTFR